MGRVFSIMRVYRVPAQVLWTDLVDFDALAESMEGAITYVEMPKGEPKLDRPYTVRLKRWGLLPMGRWMMTVVERDNAALQLRSEEHGGPVKLYHHRLNVVRLDGNLCQYTDTCDVNAGWLTPLIAPMFQSMYEKRHEMRRKRLEERAP